MNALNSEQVAMVLDLYRQFETTQLGAIEAVISTLPSEAFGLYSDRDTTQEEAFKRGWQEFVYNHGRFDSRVMSLPHVSYEEAGELWASRHLDEGETDEPT